MCRDSRTLGQAAALFVEMRMSSDVAGVAWRAEGVELGLELVDALLVTLTDRSDRLSLAEKLAGVAAVIDGRCTPALIPRQGRDRARCRPSGTIRWRPPMTSGSGDSIDRPRSGSDSVKANPVDLTARFRQEVACQRSRNRCALRKGLAGCQGRFPQLVVDRGVKSPRSCCHGWQLHTRREFGPAVMPAQGFDNRRSRVHQGKRIAVFDHAFVPVGRSVEIRREQVVDHPAPEGLQANRPSP